MVKVYCDLIAAGLRTLEQVPARIRAQVEQQMQEEAQA